MKRFSGTAMAILLFSMAASAQEFGGAAGVPEIGGGLAAPTDPVIGTGRDYLARAEAARRIGECRRAYLSFQARNTLRPSERLRLMQECFVRAAAGEEAAVADNAR